MNRGSRITRGLLAAAALAAVALPGLAGAQGGLGGGMQPTPTPTVAAAQPQIAWTTIEQTGTVDLATYVYVRAKLVSIVAPDDGSRQPYQLFLSDNTGTRRAVIWQHVWQQMPNPDQFKPGMIVDLYAKVGDYKGVRQLEIESPQWMRVAPVRQPLSASAFRDQGPSASTAVNDGYVEINIGAINTATYGRNVRIKGTVAELNESPAPRVPTKVLLKDQTGQVEVVYWTEVADTLTEFDKPVVGMEWEARGTVQDFRGKPQVKVMTPGLVGRPQPVGGEGFPAPSGGQTPPQP
ncbi:hypothetical protein HZA57_01660 [Candidatus Poribacteria bacterium]|nr:hypothetical protein [Candidatus Poribacteria bacterium]